MLKSFFSSGSTAESKLLRMNWAMSWLRFLLGGCKTTFTPLATCLYRYSCDAGGLNLFASGSSTPSATFDIMCVSPDEAFFTIWRTNFVPGLCGRSFLVGESLVISHCSRGVFERKLPLLADFLISFCGLGVRYCFLETCWRS